MNQKIEWYKEVLALEPASKVFFPLARMQAENGLAEDALATLRQGLGRNPEHIEARLLLIDILFGLRQFDALWPELDQIALMLGGYPGFWSAWNTRLARNPSSKDASLALSFFSATLRGEAVSWTDVIENGLRALLAEGTEGDPRSSARGAAPKVAPAELNELHSYLNKAAGSDAATKPAGTSKSAPSVVLEALSGDPQNQDEPQDPEDADLLADTDADIDAETEPEDEVFSLKTRSMAEVLAEQGDYAGALDIYEELLRETENASEKQSLKAAIAAISARAGDNISASGAAEAAEQDDGLPAGQGKNRLMDVLEALAQRLEARG